MGKLLVQEKSVVVPGEVIAEGMDYLPSDGTYRFEEKILSNKLGLLVVDGKVLKTIPLAGRYLPKIGDVVIGKVIDILMSGWRMDIHSAYSAVLPLQNGSFNYIQKGADLSKIFAIDDCVITKITNVTSQNLVDVTMKGPGLRKLSGGKILEVNHTKVPRIIGKKGSMVSLIKDVTGCRIIVGQNGLIWVQGEPEQEVITIKTIRKIEAEAHKSGLTDEVKVFLEKNKKPLKEPRKTYEEDDFSKDNDSDEPMQNNQSRTESNRYNSGRDNRDSGRSGGYRPRFHGRRDDGPRKPRPATNEQGDQ